MDCVSDEMPDTVNGQSHMLRTLVRDTCRCVLLSAMTPLESVQPWLGSPTPHFAGGSKASSTNMMPNMEAQKDTVPISWALPIQTIHARHGTQPAPETTQS